MQRHGLTDCDRHLGKFSWREAREIRGDVVDTDRQQQDTEETIVVRRRAAGDAGRHAARQ